MNDRELREQDYEKCFHSLGTWPLEWAFQEEQRKEKLRRFKNA